MPIHRIAVGVDGSSEGRDAAALGALLAGAMDALLRIGVGYDGKTESAAALDLAAMVARAAEAQLQLLAVVDGRVPVMVRSALTALVKTEWNEAVWEQEWRLGTLAGPASEAAGVSSTCGVLRGRPADALLALSHRVDMLVIGSRRWGPAARALLGSTGEPILHDAGCPVLVVPRPGRHR